MTSSILPTSTAATQCTEQEVVAGISSGEGRPAQYDFRIGEKLPLIGLVTCGAAAVLGFAIGFGLMKCGSRSAGG